MGKLWICIFLHAATDPANEERLPSELFLYVYEQVETFLAEMERPLVIGYESVDIFEHFFLKIKFPIHCNLYRDWILDISIKAINEAIN